MNGPAAYSSSCGYPQAFVDQRPAYDRKRKGRRKNQILSREGIIRKDKRYKVKYL